MVAPALEKIVSTLQAGGSKAVRGVLWAAEAATGYSIIMEMIASRRLMKKTFANSSLLPPSSASETGSTGEITSEVTHPAPSLWLTAFYTTPSIFGYGSAALGTLAVLEKIPKVLQYVGFRNDAEPYYFAMAALMYSEAIIGGKVLSMITLKHAREVCGQYTAKHGGNQTTAVRMI